MREETGEQRLVRVRAMSALDRLLYWIKEREAVRLKKEAGEPRPWTADPILQRYRFCNVRRMDDKVSRWLLEHWYTPHKDHPNMLLACAVARFFNLPRTLSVLTPLVFGKGWPAARMKAVVRKLRKAGGPVFNAAYMVRGNDGPDKVESVIDHNVGALKKDKVKIDPNSMERSHAAVAAVYGFGSFMAGQVVADLRHAVSGSWADCKKWAPLGPGSQRGLNRLYGFTPKSPQSQEEFRGMLDDTVLGLKKDLPKKITTRLDAMDYQNCLCEYDKYSRVLEEDGRPKQTYPGEGEVV